MTQREKLIEILSRYFTIGDSDEYSLLRDKSAFAIGTMSLEDFVEFDDEKVADIADHLLANGVVVLPCKISAKVYDIRRFYKRSRVVSQEIVCGEIDHFRIGDAGEVITTVCFQGNEWADYRPDDLILTHEEAEAALKKMEGRK